MQCHIVKNILLHTAFSANLPAGMRQGSEDRPKNVGRILLLAGLYTLREENFAKEKIAELKIAN